MSLDRDVDMLRGVPLFAACDVGQLRLIAFNAERRAYRDGQYLCRAGDAARGAFVIVSGTVLVMRAGAGEEVVESRLGPGAALGETAVLAAGTRPADARADGSVECLEIGRPVFRRLLEEYPDVAAALHERLRARLAGFLDELQGVRPRFGPPAG